VSVASNFGTKTKTCVIESKQNFISIPYFIDNPTDLAFYWFLDFGGNK
jgi:hypothetical protein